LDGLVIVNPNRYFGLLLQGEASHVHIHVSCGLKVLKHLYTVHQKLGWPLTGSLFYRSIKQHTVLSFPADGRSAFCVENRYLFETENLYA